MLYIIRLRLISGAPTSLTDKVSGAEEEKDLSFMLTTCTFIKYRFFAHMYKICDIRIENIHGVVPYLFEHNLKRCKLVVDKDWEMETTTAYCGLTCDTCPVHLATLEKDRFRQLTMRASIAEQCTTLYGMNLQPEEITDCDGCRADTGRIFSGCLQCEIRKCANRKNIDSCAFCNDYACETLEKHFLHDPDSKTRLEEIRQRKN